MKKKTNMKNGIDLGIAILPLSMILILVALIIVGTIETITANKIILDETVPCLDSNKNIIIGLECQKIIYCGVFSNIFIKECKDERDK